MTNQLCSVVDCPSFIITSTLPPDTRLQEVMLFAMYSEAGSQDTLATTHCLRHDLSCDIDKRAEEWIRKAHAPKLYVQKLDDVSDMIVFDTISQSFQPMPQNFACICSWACQDVCFGLKHIYFQSIGGVKFILTNETFMPLWNQLMILCTVGQQAHNL